jgi:hypothetical protein
VWAFNNDDLPTTAAEKLYGDETWVLFATFIFLPVGAEPGDVAETNSSKLCIQKTFFDDLADANFRLTVRYFLGLMANCVKQGIPVAVEFPCLRHLCWSTRPATIHA